MKVWRLVSRVIAWQVLTGTGCAQLIGIPTVPYHQSYSTLPLQNIKHIVIDRCYANYRDNNGSTLIPPSLQDFATTFAKDLHDTLGIDAKVAVRSKPSPNSIFLTLGKAGNYIDAAGRPTSEGYTLSANAHGITVTGASPLGAWWGTRTVLQQALLHNGTIPIGIGTDSPGWGTRGMMLDCGRHFYPKDFLIEMCSYMSFFKQNTFHLHLSDNLFASDITPINLGDVYARFRLFSDSPAVKGLSNFANESYTRSDFDEIQTKCAARGVTIVPEIEAPGHALPIVQWRPQIGFKGDLTLLNISHPDTIPTMKTIWKEFLPWFHSKYVSIGADEYSGPEYDYKMFVNKLASFIGGESGKSIRIWGTFPPKKQNDNDIETFHNVTMQHWAFGYGNPRQSYIDSNYSVINSDEMFYIVLKYGGYARTIDISRTFTGNPSNKGKWEPNIFSLKRAADNVAREEKLVRGAIAPMWNDQGPNASVYSEAYYAWKQGIPALADKQWGGNLTSDQYPDVFGRLLAANIPGENLERRIKSKGSVIFNYTDFSTGGGKVKDSSPNGYNASTDCRSSRQSLQVTPSCSLTMPLSSKGRNYTLSISLKLNKLPDPNNTTLLSGEDSALMLTPNITLFASGNYYRLNRTVELGKWLALKVVARGAHTYASVAGDGKENEFLAGISNGKGTVWKEIAIEAPIRRVGGWEGELRGLVLSGEA
ncbi:beta-hexosaminidase [Pochonia chlamydosporia 170]|uniref:beta-N-acetylhexosaminidase n=1 Tax=Pochonia chlamydosporia 170 TaxID=1380566 RepID=A0A179F0C1_METCM|nr:beta-hexosaminidase [Pochonia chlamydosporia 170]OAQ58894.1 beta-hexosaminidase [Pochonia chlamydosporia 170]